MATQEGETVFPGGMPRLQWVLVHPCARSSSNWAQWMRETETERGHEARRDVCAGSWWSWGRVGMSKHSVCMYGIPKEVKVKSTMYYIFKITLSNTI